MTLKRPEALLAVSGRTHPWGEELPLQPCRACSSQPTRGPGCGCLCGGHQWVTERLCSRELYQKPWEECFLPVGNSTPWLFNWKPTILWVVIKKNTSSWRPWVCADSRAGQEYLLCMWSRCAASLLHGLHEHVGMASGRVTPTRVRVLISSAGDQKVLWICSFYDVCVYIWVGHVLVCKISFLFPTSLCFYILFIEASNWIWEEREIWGLKVRETIFT